MATAYQSTQLRPREWRRRVSIRTRVTVGAHRVDGKILNISTRGMLVHSNLPLPLGTKVQVRQGAEAVVGRVVWRHGSRSGLECQSGIAIAEWLAACDSSRMTKRSEARLAGPVRSRGRERSRVFARKLEFVAATVVALAISLSVAALAAKAILKPLAAVEAALGG